jgi:hypothetical protein
MEVPALTFAEKKLDAAEAVIGFRDARPGEDLSPDLVGDRHGCIARCPQTIAAR